MGVRITVVTLLYACRTTPRGRLRRRWQIGLVRYRYNKTWASPLIRNLVERYDCREDLC